MTYCAANILVSLMGELPSYTSLYSVSISVFRCSQSDAELSEQAVLCVCVFFCF